jgi:hypothetical protein
MQILQRHKVEGAKSNTPLKTNTYKRPLIPYLEHTLNHPNVSDAKRRWIWVKNVVFAGKCRVGFE